MAWMNLLLVGSSSIGEPICATLGRSLAKGTSDELVELKLEAMSSISMSTIFLKDNMAMFRKSGL